MLYPESSGRINALYQSIIKNMGQAKNISLQSRTFSNDESAENIKQWLAEQNAQALILLGKKGLAFSLTLSLNIPVITGAHTGARTDARTGVTNNHSAVSLAADPNQLFSKLKKLQPEIKQVHVIYNEKNSGWLIKKAKIAAQKNNIKLNAIQTDSVQASAQALKKIAAQLNALTDAIWLPFDPILPIKPLLPDLLKTSWKNNLIIFSGNPYHVQQGVLFALFPDYSKLGQQLMDLTLQKLQHNGNRKIETSRYLNSAINIRTASHLGIQLSSLQKDNYKMVFPKK